MTFNNRILDEKGSKQETGLKFKILLFSFISKFLNIFVREGGNS